MQKYWLTMCLIIAMLSASCATNTRYIGPNRGTTAACELRCRQLHVSHDEKVACFERCPQVRYEEGAQCHGIDREAFLCMDSVKFQGKRTLKWAAIITGAVLVIGFLVIRAAFADSNFLGG